MSRFADIRQFDTIDSTNRYLIDQARAGAPEGVVAVADVQTAGRGRLGRTWTAPPGSSLLVSMLLRPRVEPARAHLATMAVGVAACEAVFLTAGFNPSLKWPNDLVVAARKLAGMLSEAEVRDGHLEALVVGIGINVNWTDFPPEIAATATACNVVAGAPVDRDALLASLLDRADHRLAALEAPGGDEAIVGEYRQRCATLGRPVRVELPDEVIEATAVDIDRAGHLVLDDGRSVAAGDVIHASPTVTDPGRSSAGRRTRPSASP